MSPGVESLGKGEYWEQQAARFLTGKGLTIIARRYRCRLGELDIVASLPGELVIVEVKARARSASAIATVSLAKRRRIVNATRHFLMRHSEWHSRTIRFDVIGFDRIDTPNPAVRWIRNAFDAG